MRCLLVIIALLITTPASSDYEQPVHSTVLKQGGLEIRQYHTAMAVETRVSAPRSEATGKAFRTLFKFINGRNEGAREIPMTSPVVQTLIAHDDDENENNWAVRFFLPNQMTEQDIPEPLDKGVAIVKLEAQTFASISFKGRQNDRNVAKNTAKLEAFIAENGYEPAGSRVFAFYDPPFIPWFLRDNEILIPVKRLHN